MSAITYTDNWHAAHNKGEEMVVWVTVNYLDTTEKTFNAKLGYSSVSTPASWFDCVRSVSHLGQQIDPLDRDIQVPSVTVDFMGAPAVDLFRNYRTHGFKLTVSVGFDTLQSADFATVFVGYVKNVQPLSGGAVRVKANGLAGLLKEHKLRGYFTPKHPLQIIKQILDDKMGLSSSYWSSTSLDPSQSQYAEVSHFVAEKGIVSFAGSGEGWWSPDEENTEVITEPVAASDIIAEMNRIMYGVASFDDDGIFRYRIYDASASSDNDWTTDDILAGSLKVESLDSNLVNKITITCANQNAAYSVSDSAAGTKYGNEFIATPANEKKIELPWSDGSMVTWLGTVDAPQGWASGADPAAGERIAALLMSPGVCGTNWWDGSTNQFPAGTQPSWATVSGARLLYLLIDSEIVAFDATDESVFTQANGDVSSWYKNLHDPDTGVVTEGPFQQHILLTVASSGRGRFATTAAAHDTTSSTGYDVTAAVRLGQLLLNRFSDGAPVLKCKTNMSKGWLQIGETVTITTDEVWVYGASSLSTSQKWEVIGKEMDLSSGEISWTLCHKPSASASGSAKTGNTFVDPIRAKAAALIGQDSYRSYVISGLTITNVGLVVTIAEGKIQVGDMQITVPTISVTLRASRDYYVYWSPTMSAFVFKDVANGGTAPDTSAGDVPLAKCVTNGSTVTSITDLRVTTGIVGGAVIDASIVTDKIADAAIIAEKLATNSVIWEKLSQSNTDNLTDNPGFEQGEVGWNHEAGWSIVSDGNARTGGYAAKHVTGTANAATKSAHMFSCVEGDQFHISGWFKAITTPTASCKVRVQWRDGDGVATTVEDGNTLTTPTTWQESSAMVTCPSGSTSGEIQFVVTGHTAGTVYADDGVVNRVEKTETIGDLAIVPATFAGKLPVARPSPVINPNFVFVSRG